MPKSQNAQSQNQKKLGKDVCNVFFLAYNYFESQCFILFLRRVTARSSSTKFLATTLNHYEGTAIYESGFLVSFLVLASLTYALKRFFEKTVLFVSWSKWILYHKVVLTSQKLHDNDSRCSFWLQQTDIFSWVPACSRFSGSPTTCMISFFHNSRKTLNSQTWCARYIISSLWDFVRKCEKMWEDVKNVRK